MTRRDAVKAQRKQTIRANRMLQILDSGAPPTPAGTVIPAPHPNIWCQSGVHDYEVTVLMNIPVLRCRKCWAFVFKGPHEGTETKREIRERHIPKLEPILTDDQMVDKIARMMNFNARR